MEKLLVNDIATLAIEKNYYGKFVPSQLIEWLRVEHNIYVTALPFREEADEIELCFYYSLIQDDEELHDILCNETDLGVSVELYDDFDQAINAGLLNALELI